LNKTPRTPRTLQTAKKNKKDEFYTQMKDIEKELVHYETLLEDKIIYCNCDEEFSNFYLFFKNNFKRLKLKKLIVTCFRKDAKGVKIVFDGLEEIKETMSSDGDFRNDENIKILKEVDIVITNPPFSLFREFVQQLNECSKDFLIIGNINCITYKEIFKLIQENKVWLGEAIGRGISGFIVPKEYELYGTETKTDEDGNQIISPNNCLWLSTLDIEKRHTDLELTKTYNESNYPKYDNYNGINVNKTKDIPKDYDGVMGVPITFLHKFNPSQFKIIKFRKGDDDKDLCVNSKCPYFRILIQRKTKENK